MSFFILISIFQYFFDKEKLNLLTQIFETEFFYQISLFFRFFVDLNLFECDHEVDFYVHKNFEITFYVSKSSKSDLFIHKSNSFQ